MRKCPKCGLPETFETIELPDDGGPCNLCVNHDITTALPWAERKKELDALIEKHRGKHEYDLILPFSGAKDSTWALYYLMTEYKIKPLVVRVDHGFMRPKMLKNVERTLKKLGADFLSFTPNWKLVKRVMLEAFIRKTDFCWGCHTSIFSYPMTLAIKYNTRLIMWGEPSSSYTSYFSPTDKELVDESRFDTFVNLGISAEDMAGMVKHDSDFDFRDFAPFTFPKKSELNKLGVESVCLGSYIRWDVRKQVEIIQRELGWEGDEIEGGVPGQWEYDKPECFMQAMRDWIKFLKRDYSRTSQNCALDIRNGRMTPDEADVYRAQEGRRPASFPIFLEYLGITEAEFFEHIERSVVPPNVMNLSRGEAKPVHDMNQWYREPCSPKD